MREAPVGTESCCRGQKREVVIPWRGGDLIYFPCRICPPAWPRVCRLREAAARGRWGVLGDQRGTEHEERPALPAGAGSPAEHQRTQCTCPARHGDTDFRPHAMTFATPPPPHTPSGLHALPFPVFPFFFPPGKAGGPRRAPLPSCPLGTPRGPCPSPGGRSRAVPAVPVPGPPEGNSDLCNRLSPRSGAERGLWGSLGGEWGLGSFPTSQGLSSSSAGSWGGVWEGCA